LQAFRRVLGLPQPLDIPAAILAEWRRLDLGKDMTGKSIALGVGSRGITGLPEAAKCLIDLIHAAGGKPFIIPAMGSHGGATGPGQADMLAGLGITEKAMGCPIHSSMELSDYGISPEGIPLFCDKAAASADGILLFNRVKAHTSFTAPVESGIHKMIAIGLGKEKAATWLHAQGPSGLARNMPLMARALVRKVPFLAGFAVVEDAAHQPAKITALTADDMEEKEPALLAYAKSLSPSLPVEAIDLLIVDEIGKNISGTGMDTHVIGRLRIQGELEPLSPQVAAIVALRLSEATHGNALGIGLADFIPRDMLAQVDFDATARNVYATGNLERGRIPLVFPDDRAAIQAALQFVFRREPTRQANARILRIANTLELGRGWFSPALNEEMSGVPGLSLWGEPQVWPFDAQGKLAHGPRHF